MSVAVATKNRKELRENEKKWGQPLMKAGWCLLPTVILDRQQALGLSPTDVNILLHIIKHWWHAERLPFPSKRAIAECMGVHPSTVQRRIRKMEAAGFVKREKRSDREHGQRSNYYNLSGLVREATPFAQEVLDERSERAANEDQRRKRKRPRLKVVDGGARPR